MIARGLLALGALYGLLAVALGAFGAHALRGRLGPEMGSVWQTAVQYHFWHALALLFVGYGLLQRPSPWLAAAGIGFALGVLLFSGSLYALALTGLRGFGPVTPVGGLLLMGGWLCLLVAALKL